MLTLTLTRGQGLREDATSNTVPASKSSAEKKPSDPVETATDSKPQARKEIPVPQQRVAKVEEADESGWLGDWLLRLGLPPPKAKEYSMRLMRDGIDTAPEVLALTREDLYFADEEHKAHMNLLTLTLTLPITILPQLSLIPLSIHRHRI